MADSTTIPEPGQPADGRRAWRDRNRLAVVDALLDLYAEGNLQPGAHEVAERSGVSRRSVFRYFDDLDELARFAIERQQQRVWHLIEMKHPGEGPLASRVSAIAAQRAALFGAVLPAGRVMRLRAPFNPVIDRELARSRRSLARQVELQFAPELEAMDAPSRAATLAAAEALCSFETFELLTASGRSPAKIRAAIERGLAALFGV